MDANFYNTLDRIIDAFDSGSQFDIKFALSKKDTLYSLVNDSGESLLWYAPLSVMPHLLSIVNPNIKSKRDEIFLNNANDDIIDLFLDFLYNHKLASNFNPNVLDKKNNRIINFIDWSPLNIKKFLQYSGPNFSEPLNPNTKMVCGTLLHFFADHDENYEILELIILKRPNPHIKDSNGFTPLDIAIENGTKKNTKLLRDYIKEYKVALPIMNMTRSWSNVCRN